MSDSAALWPGRPISVSPTEGIIEAFWHTRLNKETPQRWQVSLDDPVGSIVLNPAWDATELSWTAPAGRDAAEMKCAYDLDLGEYDGLLVRLRPGADLRVSIYATLDGHEVTLVENEPGSNETQELGGPIHGQKLTGLRLRFAGDGGHSHEVQLRWVMLTRPGEKWQPPAHPFEGFVVEEPVGRFEPGLELILSSGELARLREMMASPLYSSLWEQDRQLAEREFQVNPVSQLRQYGLYAPERYGRVADARFGRNHDGLVLALVGLLTHNEDYMRRAAQHALVYAHMEHWAEGFVDRFPLGEWYHSGFAPTVATIRTSLLLDWAWHWLTPAGRQFVRDAIQTKGLPYIERAKDAMANQGVRFNKARVLGHMAVRDNWQDAQLQQVVRDSLRIINQKMEEVVHPDGTFSEGMGYGQGTLASTMLTYHAMSRCLGQPIRDLVSPLFLPAMRYILDAEHGLAPTLAAFCAGPLGDETFASQCMPCSLFEAGVYGYLEFGLYGLAALWSPRILPAAHPLQLPAFRAYWVGGWVFANNSDPDQPNISLESGLWDGIGHHWLHQNAVTLDGWGERLLLTRNHLGYLDARYRYTARTAAYNTFSPDGRDQDASGTPGRGAVLRLAEDLGPVAVMESDAATAWRTGVELALRRVLFIRPGVLIVEDTGRFTDEETGVQSWNSLGMWESLGPRACQSQVGAAAVRLTVVLPEDVELTLSEDSVHRDLSRGKDSGHCEFPVYRCAATSPAGRAHRLLTVIEAIPPQGKGSVPDVCILDDGLPLIEVRQGERIARIAGGPVAGDALWGCATDGTLSFAVRQGDVLVAAGAWEATRLQTPLQAVTGQGFLRYTPEGER